MDALDEIPWKDLTHAYGSAADVPDLLRLLRTASPDLQGEDSPLWQLFGNIWHQGTVYEATSYAVPFLIELAVDRRTPDRVGILSLLAEIANGSSYRVVHGNLLNEPDYKRKQKQELLWVRRAHEAVAAGFTQFVGLTKEPGDVRYAAAQVLSRLPDHRAEVAAVLRSLFRDEKRIPYRAGLLLLFRSIGDVSQETLSVLSDAVNATEVAERHAAAFSLVRLNVRPLPAGAPEAIMDAIVAQDLDVSGRSKPATDGRLKTSHFEETPIRQVALSVQPVPHEANHVQSAQSGHDRNHLVPPSTRLVAATYRTRTRHRSPDGGTLSPTTEQPSKTSHCAPRL